MNHISVSPQPLTLAGENEQLQQIFKGRWLYFSQNQVLWLKGTQSKHDLGVNGCLKMWNVSVFFSFFVPMPVLL